MRHPQTLKELAAAFPETDHPLPALFVGHGSPLNAIEDNDFSRAWIETGRALPRPRAILCISAHWETNGTKVTAMKRPRTIHDFSGFPVELFAMQYPAPGSFQLARLILNQLADVQVRFDKSWGLDHGAWSVLQRLFPTAEIPVVQLSLDRSQPPAAHYAMGQQLSALRRRGVLLVGSGNMVHNLRMLTFQVGGVDWARQFDQLLRSRILAGDHAAIIDYLNLGPGARLAVPTNEHFLPLLYILGAQEPGEPQHFFAEGLVYGSISMRSLWIG